MEEYPAMIYQNGRSKTFVANCMAKNLIGFGRTEEDALNNLKASIEHISKKCEFVVKPIYGLFIAQ